MLKAVLIDDEPDALELLSLMLREQFAQEVKIVGQTTEFNVGVLLVKEYAPDLLFLDIELGEGRSGFDLLNNVKTLSHQPKVVFTTGYQQFAIKAVQVQAFDYLLKPIDPTDIRQLLDRIRASPPLPISPLQAGVLVHTTEAIYRIQLDEILYFEGNGNYTNVHIKDKDRPVLASVTLNHFEEEVKQISHAFFRIHKSFLVNLRAIEQVDKRGLGKTLLLTDGTRLSISRLRFKAFMDAFR